MLADEALAAALPGLLPAWRLDRASVTPLGGGMNSATALVRTPTGERYVAKWVPDDRRAALVSGARLAARLAADGLVTGPPRPAVDGALVVPLLGGWCSLVVFVPGAPLDGASDDDQRRMARTLAAVHRVTVGAAPGAFFSWLTAGLPALDREPWLRPAVAAALAAHDRLPRLTHAWLHTDPAPEAFRADPGAGATGLIDWTGAEVGPVLYDVASAVMYLGGPSRAGTFLATYADAGIVTEAELAHLAVLRRFRWAVQAAYFAGRLATRDLTGTDDAGNAQGLADARRGLAEWP